MIGKAVIGFVGVASLAVAGSVPGSAPVGIEAVRQFEHLSLLRPYAWAYQTSSHDRAFRNYDWTSFLGWKGSEKIVLDVKGPGCVYRMWFTSSQRPINGTIRIYLDGSSTPVVEIPMRDFFRGDHPWFPSPLVGNPAVSSGGYYCYVPIPFRTGCRITHTSPAELTYYNITYHRYVTADGITTFDGSQATATTVAQWNSAGQDPKPSEGNQVLAGTAGLAARGSAALASLSGPGVVNSIELELPSVTQQVLTSLRLRLSWDGLGSAVDVPVGSFFGSGLGPATVRGLPVGMLGERLYCYFPMPFRRQAQIALYNASDNPIGGIGYRVAYRSQPVPANTGRFYCLHASAGQLPEGVDYNFLTTTGTGHLAGIVQTLRGSTPGQWYLEGDERIYVDGALTPALHGTGTEDFFNGGWYFEYGTFSLPLHGAPLHLPTSATTEANTCYRFMLGDLIPFRSMIRAGIEHGGWNEDPVQIESVAFYYKSPRSTLFLADAVDVGDSNSETAHAYTCTNVVWSGTNNSLYASNGDQVYATDSGRWLGLGGTSQFTVVTDPPGGYVVLRRRLDYNVPRQEADVYVDGVLAGTWYDAGSSASDGSRKVEADAAFRDSDFFIPPALARGKRSLDIRIVNTSAESEWTEYHYWAFIVHDGTTAAPDFDYDGDVDQEDFAFMQACLSGSYTAPVDLRCRTADLDGDEDIDSVDAGLFLNCLSGSGRFAELDCAD
ncbi:MAG TPA: DUF2961 domain-containing protein [Phycisphaerae bacterium]|nr:DUF2961 domain-containing protein [Phycisphaerae bacterium]HQE26807.1 DUF2961 domain-containing protein [Phycisphaerae bacterium]